MIGDIDRIPNHQVQKLFFLFFIFIFLFLFNFLFFIFIFLFLFNFFLFNAFTQEQYKPPTTALRMALGPVIPYAKITQLSMNKSPTGRFHLNSHMIAMPFSGPEEISKVCATNLPRSAKEVAKLLRVYKII